LTREQAFARAFLDAIAPIAFNKMAEEAFERLLAVAYPYFTFTRQWWR
jgi:hypothetical protein